MVSLCMMQHERSGLTKSERYRWLAETDNELHLKKPGLLVLENAVIKGGCLNQLSGPPGWKRK